MGTTTDRLLEIIDEKESGKVTIFADKAGIPKSTFHAYKQGRDPSAEHLVRISECYGVNIHWLLTGEGEKYFSETEKIQFPMEESDPEKLMGQAYALLTHIMSSKDPRVIRAILSNLQVFKMTIDLQTQEKKDRNDFKTAMSEYEARLQRLERYKDNAPASDPPKKNGTALP